MHFCCWREKKEEETKKNYHQQQCNNYQTTHAISCGKEHGCASS